MPAKPAKIAALLTYRSVRCNNAKTVANRVCTGRRSALASSRALRARGSSKSSASDPATSDRAPLDQKARPADTLSAGRMAHLQLRAPSRLRRRARSSASRLSRRDFSSSHSMRRPSSSFQ